MREKRLILIFCLVLISLSLVSASLWGIIFGGSTGKVIDASKVSTVTEGGYEIRPFSSSKDLSNCFDSDFGLNYNVFGYVSGNSTNDSFYFSDYCSGLDILMEYICFGSSPLGMTYDCSDEGKVCEGGECVTQINVTCTDNDGDGYSVEGGDCGAVDCNDNLANINPRETEVCWDNLDNNCDGVMDEAGCIFVHYIRVASQSASAETVNMGETVTFEIEIENFGNIPVWVNYKTISHNIVGSNDSSGSGVEINPPIYLDYQWGNNTYVFSESYTFNTAGTHQLIYGYFGNASLDNVTSEDFNSSDNYATFYVNVLGGNNTSQCFVDDDCPSVHSSFCNDLGQACTSSTIYSCLNNECVVTGGGGGCTPICPNGCLGGVCVSNQTTTCGDVNGDGIVNIIDIIYLANYKYKNGPAPVSLWSANVNADGYINVLDIVYLINYKYKNGPEPTCAEPINQTRGDVDNSDNSMTFDQVTSYLNTAQSDQSSFETRGIISRFAKFVSKIFSSNERLK